MGKIMEALFCVFYLIFTFIMGCKILKKSNGRKEILLYGIMTLVFGDSFHLVPRVLAVIHPDVNYTVSLGIGKMITSITMTFFYLILFFIFEMRYGKKHTALRMTMIILAIIRVVLCLMPQNDWTGADPVIWGIYRNIPFTIIGLIMVVLYFHEKADKTYKWMWFAILMSFAFYLPVVLWADVHPMIGMLMLPKTCMYMWMVVMGHRETATKAC